jgi:1-acyl-sn-glycerol-3-phosphate acyltransferase
MAVDPHDISLSTTAATARQDAWLWRLVMTAVYFCLFGLGALVVGAVLLPVVKVLPAARVTKRARARKVIQSALRVFVALMRFTGSLTYEIQGRERLGRAGQLIIANHPSLIDVVFLLAFTPAAVGCVVKHGLWRNPLTRLAVTLAEFIPNQPTVQMIDSAATALAQAQALIMFPEGTRSRPGEPRVFHRGAANVALRSAQVVTPVYIQCRPATLTKAEPWYRIPARRPHFRLCVGEDIDLQRYRD